MVPSEEIVHVTTLLQEAAMEIEDRRICDVIARLPEAEEILENAGVDYWFGWERKFRGACEAAHIDPHALAGRMIDCPPGTDSEPRATTLTGLLLESNDHWARRLLPAIDAACASFAGGADGAGERAAALLCELRRELGAHMEASRSLLSIAAAIDAGQPALVNRRTVRSLQLKHLELSRIAQDLKDEASRMTSQPALTGPAVAIRTVVREVHRHLKVAYNFILPRLVPAVAARVVACEPW
jgi:hypothetical protein